MNTSLGWVAATTDNWWTMHHVGGGWSESPPEILDRRLADGTLTSEGYERRRDLLASSSGT